MSKTPDIQLDKDARRARALRANLKKRRAQAHTRDKAAQPTADKETVTKASSTAIQKPE